MKESVKKKVNRIGLAGRIISIILIVMMAAACFGLLVGGVALAVLPREAVTIGAASDIEINVQKKLLGPFVKDLPEEKLTEINAELNLNGKEYADMKMEQTEDELKFTARSERFELDLSRLASAVFTGLIYCAAMLVVFIFLLKLCTAFHRCESPFDDLVIKRMNVFAWVLVGCAVVASIAEGIVNALLDRTLDLSFALNPSDMNTGFNVSFSFAPILIALIVLFLTVVFRYGAQLQKESDETL